MKAPDAFRMGKRMDAAQAAKAVVRAFADGREATAGYYLGLLAAGHVDAVLQIERMPEQVLDAHLRQAVSSNG